MRLKPEQIKDIALTVINTEATAVSDLHKQIDENFLHTCKLMEKCRGRIVLIGMGKSGHIAKKISSTLASTGSAAFYIHPAEAAHGDLGMIGRDDIAIVVSYSGETGEINMLLPALKELDIPLIALTGSPDSTLAKNADSVINTSVEKEACPLGLAPTASTTAALAMGDALAVVLQSERGFTSKDFAKAHPSGQLGRRLTMTVADLMRTNGAIPKVTPDTILSDALYEMSRKGLGMTLIVDQHDKVIGIFTDGDLRRSLESSGDIKTTTVDTVMTRDFRSTTVATLAYEALNVMQVNSINSMPVFDDQGTLAGALNMHDLLHAGL